MSHQAELPIGAITEAIKGHLYGLWVQTRHDGTVPDGAGPVRVSVQYGWQGSRLAEHGDGATTAAASADLLARLSRPAGGATVGNRPDLATPRVAKATRGAKGAR